MARTRTTRGTRHVARALLTLGAAAFVSAGALITCMPPEASAHAAPTQPKKPLTPTAKVRVGQPYVTPGNGATQGPVGTNPSKANGIKLTILNGLLNGQPIINADFADPFAL